MTKKELERKVEELERRLRDVEARPIYVQPVVIPYPAPQPMPYYRPQYIGPCDPVYPTITCFHGPDH